MKQKITKPSSINEFYKKVVRRILFAPKQSLDSGRNIPQIDLRPREVLGLFCILLITRLISRLDLTVSSDPESGDGIIYDRQNEIGYPVEQTYLYSDSKGSVTDNVLKLIMKKEIQKQHPKGERALLIFTNKKGKLDWKKLKLVVRDFDHFNAYWVVGRYSPNKLNYIVLILKSVVYASIAYLIEFGDDINIKILGKL